MMARLFVLALCTILLSGCITSLPDLQFPSHDEPQSIGEALANLKADALIDLDAAQVIALAHNDVIAAACWPALKRFLTEQTGTATPSVDQVNGVFSG